MKKLLILFLILFGLINYGSSQDIQWINPLPQGNNLMSMCHADSAALYAAGYHGTIIKSTDNGQNWEIQSTPTTKDLYDIAFQNTDLGVAAGYACILFTDNGGQTWDTSSNNTMGQLESVNWQNNQNLVACGRDGLILRSEDEGASWYSLSSPTAIDLFSVEFPTETTGYIAGGGNTAGGNPVVLKSTDGGQTWFMQCDSLEHSLYDIHFTDSLNGYAAGNFSYVVKTSDGGNTWTELSTPDNSHIRSISATESGYIIACDAQGNIITSMDAGDTWTTNQEYRYESTFFHALAGNQYAYICGLGGRILRTEINAAAFENLTGTVFNHLVGMGTPENGNIYIGGDGILMHSDDFGENWTYHSHEKLNGLTAIDFTSPDFFYALTFDGIYKSTNSGTSWTWQHEAYKANFMKDLSMASPTLGFAVGGGISPGGAQWATCLKTTDGQTWNNISIGAGEYLTSVYVHSSSEIYITGSDGKLYHSTDAGNNWHTIHTEISNHIAGICILEEKFFLLGINPYDQISTVYRTENNQSEWDTVYQVNAYLNHLETLGDSLLCLYGTNSTIVQSSDMGETWSEITLPTNNNISDVHFISDSCLLFAGSYGSLLQMGDIPDSSETEPAPQNGFRVYPNPASEEILLSFTSYSSSAKLEMFDLSGKQIMSIGFNTSQGYVRHKLMLPGDIHSGIYLLRIKQNGQSREQKLLIRNRP